MKISKNFFRKRNIQFCKLILKKGKAIFTVEDATRIRIDIILDILDVIVGIIIDRRAFRNESADETILIFI